MMPFVSILVDIISAVLVISGAGSPEELSESEMERFEHFARNPLKLNLAPRSRLLASGLMSSYQIASLEDYQRRFGDVLSLTELGAVDGFTPEYAQALSFFISFEAHPPGRKAELIPLRQSLMTRYAARSDETPNGLPEASAKGMKYQLEVGDRAELSLATRSTYSIQEMSSLSFSMALYGKRGGKLVLGDFNARFGQGLIMWSGFSMSGFSSVSAFRKNASGLSHTSSFSPVFRGLGKDYLLGRYTVSVAVDVPSMRSGGTRNVMTPVISLNRLSRNASFGMQGWSRLSANPTVRPASATSLDWRIGKGFFNIYGEAACSIVGVAPAGGRDTKQKTGRQESAVSDWSAVAGVIWSPAYRQRYALIVRHYGADFCADHSGAARSSSKSADEDGLALGAKYKWAELTLDAVSHPSKKTWQHKGVLNLAPEIHFGRDSLAPVFSPAFRCVLRQNAAGIRQEYRADAAIACRGFTLKYRYDAVAFRGFAWLQYLEVGHRGAHAIGSRQPAVGALQLEWSAFARGSIFCIDNWDDRIYSYERDIPGAFSVPAYYGRGYALSAIATLKIRHRLPSFRLASESRLFHAFRRTLRHSLSARASLLRFERPSTFLHRLEFKVQYQIGL